MSIDAMTDRAINARFGEVPVNFVPSEQMTMPFVRNYDFDLVAKSGIVSTAPISGQITSTNTTPTGTALSTIVAYIPTEVVTTYVAILAALGSIASQSSLEKWVTFWVFLGFTPVATWVVYAVKLKGRNALKGLKFKQWPWWELFSASLAFTVWAYALPGSAFSSLSWYKPGLGTAGLLFISFLLGMLAPLFQPTAS